MAEFEESKANVAGVMTYSSCAASISIKQASPLESHKESSHEVLKEYEIPAENGTDASLSSESKLVP
jgi:hypothetical protein